MKEVTHSITKPIAVLSENERGYTKEANYVSWNGNDPKLDIREWHPNHERCGKGVTLTYYSASSMTALIAIWTSSSELNQEKLKRTAPRSAVPRASCIRGAQWAPARVAIP